MRFALLCLALVVFCGAGPKFAPNQSSGGRGPSFGKSSSAFKSSSPSYGSRSSATPSKPSNSRVSGAVSGLQNAPVGRSADFYDKHGKYEGSVRKGATGFTTEDSRHSFSGSMTKNPTGYSRFDKQGKYEGQIRINGKKK